MPGMRFPTPLPALPNSGKASPRPAAKGVSLAPFNKREVESSYFFITSSKSKNQLLHLMPSDEETYYAVLHYLI